MDRSEFEKEAKGVKRFLTENVDCDGMMEAHKDVDFDAFHANVAFTNNAIMMSETTVESHKKPGAIKKIANRTESKKSEDGTDTIGRLAKHSRNTSTFEPSVDVPKSLNDSKADMSNSVISTTTSVCTTGKVPFCKPTF